MERKPHPILESSEWLSKLQELREKEGNVIDSIMELTSEISRKTEMKKRKLEEKEKRRKERNEKKKAKYDSLALTSRFPKDEVPASSFAEPTVPEHSSPQVQSTSGGVSSVPFSTLKKSGGKRTRQYKRKTPAKKKVVKSDEIDSVPATLAADAESVLDGSLTKTIDLTHDSPLTVQPSTSAGISAEVTSTEKEPQKKKTRQYKRKAPAKMKVVKRAKKTAVTSNTSTTEKKVPAKRGRPKRQCSLASTPAGKSSANTTDKPSTSSPVPDESNKYPYGPPQTPIVRPPFPTMGVDQLQEGSWVALIHERNWYPGLVEEVRPESLIINFLARSAPNTFFWPYVTDRREVEKVGPLYILKNQPEPISANFMTVSEWKYLDFLSGDHWM